MTTETYMRNCLHRIEMAREKMNAAQQDKLLAKLKTIHDELVRIMTQAEKETD